MKIEHQVVRVLYQVPLFYNQSRHPCSISTVIFLHQNIRVLYLVTLYISISSSLCIISSVLRFYKSSFACVLYQERRRYILMRTRQKGENTHFLSGEMTVKDEIKAGGATC